MFTCKRCMEEGLRLLRAALKAGAEWPAASLGTSCKTRAVRTGWGVPSSGETAATATGTSRRRMASSPVAAGAGESAAMAGKATRSSLKSSVAACKGGDKLLGMSVTAAKLQYAV